MALKFTRFIENITLTETQWKDAKTKYEGVCACLDKHFYDTAYNENHKFLFGSYKLKNCVRPIVPEQDVDVLFKIDYSTYLEYQNNPSGLLQEVRKVLKEKYTTTDIIKAWGKVVLIQFSNGTHNVEVLPAYALPDKEKVMQEQASLLHINDEFRKVIITADRDLSGYSENGIRKFFIGQFFY